MYCSKCGKEIMPDWSVCSNCGAALKNSRSSHNYVNQNNIWHIKEKKKTIIIFVFVVLIICGLSLCLYFIKGKDETKNKKRVAASTAEENVIETSSAEGNAYDGKYIIGDTVKLHSQENANEEISVTLTKWGRTNTAENGNIIYVDYKIQNTGTDNVTVGDFLFDIYVDNSKVNLLDGSNSIWGDEISSGRETNGTLYAKVLPNRCTIIEVECKGYSYLLWDSSFVQSIMGSYSYENVDSGANLTLKYSREYADYDYPVINGDCWNGSDSGNFSTIHSTDYSINADVAKNNFSIEFYDIYSNKIIVYPIEDGGIYVEQDGEIMSNNTYEYTDRLSFAGTYNVGTINRPQALEDNTISTVSEDFSDVDEEISLLDSATWHYQEGENEDYREAYVTIGYDENGDLRIVGESYSSLEEISVNAVLTQYNDDGSMEFDCFDFNNYDEGILYVYPTEDGGIRIVQDGMIDGIKYTTTFDGTYQLLEG